MIRKILSLLLLATLQLVLPVSDIHAQTVYDVIKFGAKGDGKTDDAKAIQKAIDKCSSQGGGKVYLKANRTFLSGPIELKSGVDIFVDAGAVLLCNPDESIYKLSAFRDNEGEGMLWIYARNAKDISFSGKGTVDGNGIKFMGAELSDSYELKPLNGPFDPRPHVITLENVKGIRMHDLTIRNGAYWTIHLIGCDDAVISGISLLNNLKIRNGDGIDIDHSRNVRISDCYITSGDDCVCLKNRREFEEYGSCHDITVTNCVMKSRSCAIKIGSENMDSIYNVLFDNCVITASNRGLGIQNRDEGTVTNVTFSNIMLDCRYFSDVWWGKAEPIYVTSYPRAVGNHKDAGWRFPKGATEGRCGKVSKITFANIQCTSENGCFIGCDVEGKVSDITIKDMNLTIARMTDYKGGVYDKRPCVGELFYITDSLGIVVENATNVSTVNVNVRGGR